MTETHVDAVCVAVIGLDLEHCAVRAGIDVVPNRYGIVNPLVAGLLEPGVDLRVLAETLTDGAIIVYRSS
jgi:hypothetical protein